MQKLIAAYKNRKNIQYKIDHTYINGVHKTSMPMVRKGFFRSWEPIVKIYDRYYDNIQVDVILTEEQAKDHIEEYKKQLAAETKITTTKTEIIK